MVLSVWNISQSTGSLRDLPLHPLPVVSYPFSEGEESWEQLLIPSVDVFVLSILFKKSWIRSCSSNLIETSIPVCSKNFLPHNNSGVSRQFPFPSFKLNEIFSFYLLLSFIEYFQTVFKKMFWVETQSAPWSLQSLSCSAAAAINLNRPSHSRHCSHILAPAEHDNRSAAESQNLVRKWLLSVTSRFHSAA